MAPTKSHNVARRAYSAEQLLALRRSASDEPAMVIKSKTEQSAIRDHVVRGVRSLANRSSSLTVAPKEPFRPAPAPIGTRLFPVPVLGEIDPNNQNVRNTHPYKSSPTPSLTKKKAEQILEQHGSPPGLRVTAGGRIVPSDQSPLCSPRYGYSAINRNGGLIKFAPGYPPPKTFQHFAKSLPNGFVAQDPTGALCQMVDGRFLPVHEINGIPQLYLTAPNMNQVSSGKIDGSSTRLDTHSPTKQYPSGRTASFQQPPGPTFSHQILALEKQYQKLEVERRSLDKAEVLQRGKMSNKAYNQLIQKRRELVSSQDELRRSIKGLQDSQAGAEGPPVPPHAPGSVSQEQFSGMQGMQAPPMPSTQMPNWAFDGRNPVQMGASPFHPMPVPFDYNGLVPHPFMTGHMAPFGPTPPYFSTSGMIPAGFQSHSDYPGQGSSGINGNILGNVLRTNNNSGISDRGNAEQENGSTHRRQTVSEPKIKSENSSHGHKSSLNPLSAVYRPSGSKITTPEEPSGETAMSALANAIKAHNDWVGSSAEASDYPRPQGTRMDVQHSSGSSYATADFFPQNPRDHSMNKDAYPVASKSEIEHRSDPASEHPSSDDSHLSSEKERHNSNWNPTIPDHAFTATSVSTDAQSKTSEQSQAAKASSTSHAHPSQHDDASLGRSHAKQSSDHGALLQDSLSGSTVSGPDVSNSTAHASQARSYTQQGIGAVSAEYESGFRDGLARATIGSDKGKVFLDGYCAGLLQSANDGAVRSRKPTTSVGNADIHEDHPSSLISQAMPRHPAIAQQRPALELKTESLDSLKQVVFAPQNENALLSPAGEAPHVNAVVGKDLRAWSRSQEPSIGVHSVLSQLRNGQKAFPERTSSMVNRQLSSTEASSNENVKTVDFGNPQDAAAFVPPTGQALNTERRHFSAQTQAAPSNQSYLHRAYSGHRVLSTPALEWKSGSSIAQVAGMATGYFAQYDGTLNDLSTQSSDPYTPLIRDFAPGTTAKPFPLDAQIQQKHPQAKFKEGSMPNDESPKSPPTSPQGSPSKKSTSPAKAKFAQIAGRAGIKVGVSPRADTKTINEIEPADMSPQERRRWRDVVWKKKNNTAD